jgi:hypothetical protein
MISRLDGIAKLKKDERKREKESRKSSLSKANGILKPEQRGTG